MINADWIKELETTDVSQCFNTMRKGDAYCALGLGAKIVGYNFNTFVVPSWVLRELGITREIELDVINWNDFSRLSLRLRSL